MSGHTVTTGSGSEGPSRRKQGRGAAAEIALGALMATLQVIKEASGGFPPLQATIAGLLVIAEIVSKYQSNQDNIAELKRSVDELKLMIDTQLSRLSFDRYPEDLRRRLQSLERDVVTIVEDLKSLRLKRRVLRLLTTDGDGEKIQGALQHLKVLVNNFILEGTIDIERAVAELRGAVDEGFDRMGKQFGELEEIANEILNNQVNHDGLLSPRHATSARFDHHSSKRVECEQGTREKVLDAIFQWMCPDDRLAPKVPERDDITVPTGASVFWLCGQAGSGKSTIAQTVAAWCDHRDRSCLGASFFCSRDSNECSNVRLIFPTIAYQLGLHNRTFRERLSDALRTDRDVEQASAPRQLEKLIVEPLALVPNFPPCTIIIDALDECKDDQTIHRILLALSRWVRELGPIRFLITSRPEQNIHEGFSAEGLIDKTQRLVLHEIPPEVADRDIREYLRRQLVAVAKAYTIRGVWPSTEQFEALVRHSHGLFIFAATAVKYIRPGSAGDPEEQLSALLQSSRPSSSTSPYARLDALYLQVLGAAFPDIEEASKARLQLVLRSLILLRDRLSSAALEELIGLKQNTARKSLRLLHSLIVVPDSDDDVLRLIHPSFHDFIIDPARCTDTRFVTNPKLGHTSLAHKCLETLNSCLRRNICGIRDASKLNAEVPDLHQRVATHIPSHLQYACRHWTSHLADGDFSEDVSRLLKTFCEEHLLHWLEVMSILGALGDALEGLVSVQAVLQLSFLALSDLSDLLHDCERIIREFHPGISASCLQVYSGVPTFCPIGTTFHDRYFADTPNIPRLIKGTPVSWSPCIHAMEGHTASVNSVAFSSRGNYIVSGGDDKVVCLWDARTGAHLQSFAGHSGGVVAVNFHPNERLVFSASRDGTIVVWDTLAGGMLQKLYDESTSSRPSVLACSSDGKLLASGTMDGRVVLWEIEAGVRSHCTLGQLASDVHDVHPTTQYVTCLIFTRDSAYVVCSYDTNGCAVWDIHSRSIARVYEYGERDLRAKAIALSTNEELLACGYSDGTAVVWTFRHSAPPIHILLGLGRISIGGYDSIQFSPTDDSILAFGCTDGIIDLWSLSSGQRIGSLVGHTSDVTSISFSPDGLRLCSASSDDTVRIWEVKSQSQVGPNVETVVEPETSRPGRVPPLRKLLSRLKWRGFVQRERRLTERSATEDSDMIAERDVGHAKSPVRAIAFSPDGQIVATGGTDGLVRLWSTQTGQFLRIFHGPHGGTIGSISFSYDGTAVASGAYWDTQIIVGDTRTGHSTVVGAHDASVVQVAFLRDNVRLMSCSHDGTLRSWTFDATKQRDEGHTVTLLRQTWPSGVLLHQGPNGAEISAFILSDDEQFVAFAETFEEQTSLRILNPKLKIIIWTHSQSYPGRISGLSFASNHLKLAALDETGLVYFFGTLQHTPGSVDRDPAPKVYTVEGGSSKIRFSSDDRWIITDSGLVDIHAQIPHFPEPDSPSDNALAETPTSFPQTVFLRGKWLWQTTLSGGPPHRVCWVPAQYRFVRTLHEYTRGSIAVHNDLVAPGTEGGRLVIIDLSRAL